MTNYTTTSLGNCYECGRPFSDSYTIINGEKFCAICSHKFTQDRNPRLEERREEVPQATKDYVEIQWLKAENKRIKEALEEIKTQIETANVDTEIELMRLCVQLRKTATNALKP